MKQKSLLIFTVAILLSAIPLQAQPAETGVKTVWVAPFVNTSGDTVLDSAALVCRDSIVLTLKLLGGYRVPDEKPEGMEDMFTIEGSVGYGPAGVIELNARAEDLLTGKVIEERSQSKGFLGLFNAVDLLTINLLGKVTERAIVFGTATLRPAPDNLTYTIYVDDIYLGRNMTDIRVLIGTHNIEIQQDRPFGRETIHTETVTFQEGKQPVISFSEPVLTPAEETWFSRLDTRLVKDPKSNKMLNDTIGLLEETINLLSGLPSETFQTKRSEYQGHLVRLKEMKRSGRLRDKSHSISFSANFALTPFLGQFTTDYYGDMTISYSPDFEGMAGGFFELNYRWLRPAGKITVFYEAGISWGALTMYVQNEMMLDEFDQTGVWGAGVFFGAGVKIPVSGLFYLWGSCDLGMAWYFLPDDDSDESFMSRYEMSMNNMGLLVLPKAGFGVQLFNMLEIETAFFYHLHSSTNQLSRGGVMIGIGYLF
jgi:hypothetical protein